MDKKENNIKFLLKEREKIYANKFFFPQIEAIKKEIKLKGKKINQFYLPLTLLNKIKEETNIELKFKPNKIKLKKIEEKYTLVFELENKIKLTKYEKTISRELYKKYKELKEKSIEKYQLKKPIKNLITYLEYIPKQSLIICKIEINENKEIKKIPKLGKEITKDKNYSNYNLSD